MASERAIAVKRAEAMQRLDAATGTLAERFDLTIYPDALRGSGRDSDLARAQQLEAFAAVLEQVVLATEPSDVKLEPKGKGK